MTTDGNLTKNRVKFAGSWYELDDFAQRHPGGEGFINIFNGRDVTHAFRSYHPQFTDNRIRSVLHKAKDSEKLFKEEEPNSITGLDIQTTNIAVKEHEKAFKELQKEVLHALGGHHKSKGNLCFFVKCFSILAIAICLEAMQWVYGFTLLRSALHGFVIALIGLNIMHDANHGAASLNPKINFALSLVEDWIGGSYIHWRHHHVVLHHIHTNTEADPDVIIRPILRIHPKQQPNQINYYQHLYVWPLIANMILGNILVEPFDLVFGTFKNEQKGKTGNIDYRFPESTKQERMLSLILRVPFYLRFIILPLVAAPELNTVLCMYAYVAAGSLFLGSIFLLSHNYSNVKFHPGNGDNQNISFLELQVETSSNWGGWFALQLCGGLNCKCLAIGTQDYSSNVVLP